MICLIPFPALRQLKFCQEACHHGRIWRNIFSPCADLFKKITCHSCAVCYLGPVNKSYFTQSEDGSFRPVTFNQSNLADIIADVIGHEFKSALADKVRGLIDDIDLTGKVRDAVDEVDIDDIATDAIRDEVTARIENMDISVDVSL